MRDPHDPFRFDDDPTEVQTSHAPEPGPADDAGWYWTPQPAEEPPREPARLATEAAPRSRLFLAWMLAALIGALGGGAGTYLATRDDLPVAPGGVVQVAPPISSPGAVTGDGAQAVAKAVLPSIVRIDIGGFGSSGLGSGVIYRSDGYIVTNDHVVSSSRRVTVHLPDGTTLQGDVVGTAAPSVDIAVVKVPQQDLRAAVFGRSKDVQVGELAVALGSPFGLDATVTAGVISALHRNVDLGGGARFPDAIQTDAPINPGNSGGALANSRGEVIGINTAIAGGQGNVGIGFAIPIDIVRRVADQIITTGRAQLAFLGIRGDSIPGGSGARIEGTDAGGPADDAGLQAGDVIVRFDGDEVASMEELISLVISKEVGDRVSIGYLRNGVAKSTTATLAARPGG